MALGQTLYTAGFVGSRVTNDGAVFGVLRPFDNFLPAEVHAEPSAKLPFGVSKVATKRMLGASNGRSTTLRLARRRA